MKLVQFNDERWVIGLEWETLSDKNSAITEDTKNRYGLIMDYKNRVCLGLSAKRIEDPSALQYLALANQKEKNKKRPDWVLIEKIDTKNYWLAVIHQGLPAYDNITNLENIKKQLAVLMDNEMYQFFTPHDEIIDLLEESNIYVQKKDFIHLIKPDEKNIKTHYIVEKINNFITILKSIFSSNKKTLVVQNTIKDDYKEIMQVVSQVSYSHLSEHLKMKLNLIKNYSMLICREKENIDIQAWLDVDRIWKNHIPGLIKEYELHNSNELHILNTLKAIEAVLEKYVQNIYEQSQFRIKGKEKFWLSKIELKEMEFPI